MRRSLIRQNLYLIKKIFGTIQKKTSLQMLAQTKITEEFLNYFANYPR